MSPTTTTHTTTETPRSPGDPGGSASHCRRISRRTARLAAVVLAAAIAGAACGSTETPIATPSTGTPVTAAPGASVASPAAVRPTGEVDRLVAIPGGRMHLRCTGHGDATVVLISGWDGGDGTWEGIEPALAARSRVCSSARFGTGTSDPATEPRTFTDASSDLRVLLDMAGEPGPYVLLGHSFGGAVAVTFAATDPSGVKALLLLDASPTDWPSVVCTVPAYREACDLMHDPARDAERLDVFPAFDEVARISSLGDVPLTVMTGAHRDATGLSPAEVERLEATWAAGQERWAGLSSTSRIVTVEQTGHHIEVDQPARVVEELEALLGARRSDA